MRVAALCICLAVWLPTTAAEAADFHCAAGDVPCLIQAIRDANGNGEANTIRLEAGTYSLMAVDHGAFDNGTALPAIVGSLAIVGAGNEATIIQRGLLASELPRFRLFEVAQTGRLEIAHLTLARGYVPSGSGGAITSLGTLSVRNASFEGNFAGQGGAIYAPNGDLSLIDSYVVGNGQVVRGSVAIGCGGCPASATVATIARSSFFGNGGGLEAGSALYIEGGPSVDIRDSDFINNNLVGGAAIFVVGQRPVTITNTTLIGNKGTAGARGFAIWGIGNVDVLVSNSTIINNQGGVLGVRIQNSIVSGNNVSIVPPDSQGDCVNPFGSGLPVTSLGHNLFGNSAFCGALQSDLIGDPGFDFTGVTIVDCLPSPFLPARCLAPFVESGRPGGRYLRLRPDSRAIDAGSATACPATDQQGLARPIDGTGAGARACDIGAVEFYPVVNDHLQLEGLKYSFVKPSSLGFVDARASAGAFRITATFRNNGPDLCHVAFQVPVLNGPTGTNPVLLTPARELLGGQLTAVAAAKAGAPQHLISGGTASYQFTIGVQQKASINFLVDALGDATGGQCNQ